MKEKLKQAMLPYTLEAHKRLKYIAENKPEDFRAIYLVCAWLEKAEKYIKTYLELEESLDNEKEQD